jgi:glutaminyl-peptide cyclotransferase
MRKELSRGISLLVLCASLTIVQCQEGPPPSFDELAAFRFLEAQCSFGPRNPGSYGHSRCLQYLFEQLGAQADTVLKQKFSHLEYAGKTEIEYTNLIARFYPKEEKRLILCAHWDTRPFADEDPDRSNWDRPILGANDGASGVAVLLEIARGLREKKPRYGVDIVLFDGEDGGRKGHTEEYLLGSRYFARNMPVPEPEFVILLDMIGDRDLQIYKEVFSYRYAPEIVNMIWEKAAILNLHGIYRLPKHTMIDDHIPFLERGIPAVDIIDMDYPYWHTLEDTPDKCSPQSLKVIGELLLAVLYD